MIAGGGISIIATWQLPDRPPGHLLYLGILLLCLTLVSLIVSFGGVVVLWVKGIKTTGPIEGKVTCYGVAPAFVEALGILREELSKARSEFSPAKPPGSDCNLL
jgi:hypothetical protein